MPKFFWFIKIIKLSDHCWKCPRFTVAFLLVNNNANNTAGADPAIKSDRSIVAEGHRRGRRPRPVGGSGGILPRKIFEI